MFQRFLKTLGLALLDGQVLGQDHCLGHCLGFCPLLRPVLFSSFVPLIVLSSSNLSIPLLEALLSTIQFISYAASSSVLTTQFSLKRTLTARLPTTLPLDRRSRLSKVSPSGLHSASMYNVWISGVARATRCVAVDVYQLISPPLRSPMNFRVSASRSISHSAPSIASDVSRTHRVDHPYYFIGLTSQQMRQGSDPGSGSGMEQIELQILLRLDYVVARM
ncbi:hypothetical protein B0H14DRAFT_3145181 [Mycena olivaceomarginata]|nr:hypothetical protein B0H14DRAFT_3145181 [Mycena olivaceomarginata]